MIYIIIAILILLILFLIFYRDPKRIIPSEKDIILSPSDGRIIEIIELKKSKYLDIKKGLGNITTHIPHPSYLISIYLNLFHVHIQRSPVAGKIISVEHKLGKFKPTFNLALENEKTETIIKHKNGTIKIIQIAGLLARRIETWVKPKQNINMGDKIGRINFGSQVCLIIPKNTQLLVHKNQIIKAGESIIAKWKK